MAQPPKNTEAMNEQKRTSYSRNPTTDAGAGAGAGACSSYAVIDDSCGTHSYGWFSDIEAEPEILYLEYKHDIESGVYKVRNMHVPVKRPKIEISLTGEILSGDTDNATEGACSGLRKDAGFAITGETKYSRVLYIDVYSLFCREIAEIFAFHPEDNVMYKSPSESIVYFGETSDTDTEAEPIRVNTEVMRSFTTTTTLPDGRETSPCVRIFPEDDDFTLETSQIYANMLSEWKRMFSVAFITLTTTGYADYTLNCVESLRRINAEPTLQVYCIGSKGAMRIAQKDGRHSRTMQMNAPDTLSGMQTFKNENWANITFCKFPIIYSNLLSHDYVCFTDGDIVFENAAFYDYLIEHIGSNDMIVQSEWHNNDIESFCTGFMFIQSSPATIQIFDPRKVNMKNSDWDDQAYLNGESPKMKTARLPIELFPNGCFYFQNHSELNPYMIHFNWLIGNQKREKMISLGKWYGGDPVPPRPPGVL